VATATSPSIGFYVGVTLPAFLADESPADAT